MSYWTIACFVVTWVYMWAVAHRLSDNQVKAATGLAKNQREMLTKLGRR